jgi:hypothetical protein
MTGYKFFSQSKPLKKTIWLTLIKLKACSLPPPSPEFYQEIPARIKPPVP